jgi:hypothetical protein
MHLIHAGGAPYSMGHSISFAEQPAPSDDVLMSFRLRRRFRPNP